MDIASFPPDILFSIFAFDSRFFLRNNKKWIFINKIPKTDIRYSILMTKIIITKTNKYNSLVIVKKQKNILKIVICDRNLSDLEFSQYLYETILCYKHY